MQIITEEIQNLLEQNKTEEICHIIADDNLFIIRRNILHQFTPILEELKSWDMLCSRLSCSDEIIIIKL